MARILLIATHGSEDPTRAGRSPTPLENCSIFGAPGNKSPTPTVGDCYGVADEISW